MSINSSLSVKQSSSSPPLWEIETSDVEGIQMVDKSNILLFKVKENAYKLFQRNKDSQDIIASTAWLLKYVIVIFKKATTTEKSNLTIRAFSGATLWTHQFVCIVNRPSGQVEIPILSPPSVRAAPDGYSFLILPNDSAPSYPFTFVQWQPSTELYLSNKIENTIHVSPNYCKFSPDGTLLFFSDDVSKSSNCSIVKIYNTKTHQQEGDLQKSGIDTHHQVFGCSPEGTYVTTFSSTQTEAEGKISSLCVYHTATKVEIVKQTLEKGSLGPPSYQYSPNEQFFLIMHYPSIFLYQLSENVTDMKPFMTLHLEPADKGSAFARFSNDSTQINVVERYQEENGFHFHKWMIVPTNKGVEDKYTGFSKRRIEADVHVLGFSEGDNTYVMNSKNKVWKYSLPQNTIEELWHGPETSTYKFYLKHENDTIDAKKDLNLRISTLQENNSGRDRVIVFNVGK